MPQMAPTWWFSLFLIFILTYYTMMMIMYFYNVYQLKPQKNSHNSNIMNTNWKW